MELRQFILGVFDAWSVYRSKQLLNHFIGQNYGPRLFVHDLAHCIAGTGFSLADEEATALVQGTIMRDRKISYDACEMPSLQQRERPALQDFDAQFFDDVFDFIGRNIEKLDGRNRTPQYNACRLSPNDVAKFFRLASCFDDRFYREYGEFFYLMDPRVLMSKDARVVVQIILMSWKDVNYSTERRFGKTMLAESRKIGLST